MNRLITNLFVTFSVLLLFPFAVLGEELPTVVESAVKYVKNGNFSELISLYSLPTHYSEPQLHKEKKSINNALKLLSSEFGEITDLEINKDEVRWFNLELFGGDGDFVKNQPNFYQYVFKANFSKLGNGFIIITTYPIDSKSNLRSVGYALPEAEENISTLQSIGRKLTELMSPELTAEEV